MNRKTIPGICIAMLFTFVGGDGFGKDDDTFGRSSSKKKSLFVIVENGRYGYVNRRGEVVIKPRFDWSGDFGALRLNKASDLLRTRNSGREFPHLLLYYHPSFS